MGTCPPSRQQPVWLLSVQCGGPGGPGGAGRPRPPVGGPGGGEQRLGQLQTPGRRLPRLPGTSNTQTPSDDCDQVLHKHGVSDENIITMIYDDIAHSPDNPHKGEIYNQPGGENVYAGFKKGELDEQYLL